MSVGISKTLVNNKGNYEGNKKETKIEVLKRLIAGLALADRVFPGIISTRSLTIMACVKAQLSPAVISRLLKISSSTVNSHLDRLMTLGFIRRDSRGRYELTSAGELVVTKLIPKIIEAAKEACEIQLKKTEEVLTNIEQIAKGVGNKELLKRLTEQLSQLRETLDELKSILSAIQSTMTNEVQH